MSIKNKTFSPKVLVLNHFLRTELAWPIDGVDTATRSAIAACGNTRCFYIFFASLPDIHSPQPHAFCTRPLAR